MIPGSFQKIGVYYLDHAYRYLMLPDAAETAFAAVTDGDLWDLFQPPCI
jgi:hypothetical protein